MLCRHYRTKRGSSLVEFLFSFPLLVLFVLAGLDLCFLVIEQLKLEAFTRAVARKLATSGSLPSGPLLLMAKNNFEKTYGPRVDVTLAMRPVDVSVVLNSLERQKNVEVLSLTGSVQRASRVWPVTLTLSSHVRESRVSTK